MLTNQWTTINFRLRQPLESIFIHLTLSEAVKAPTMRCARRRLQHRLHDPSSSRGEVVGLDQCEARFEFVRERVSETTFVRGEALDLPFGNTSLVREFCASLNGVLHVREWSMLVREVRRVAPALFISFTERGGMTNEKDKRDAVRRAAWPAEMAATQLGVSEDRLSNYVLQGRLDMWHEGKDVRYSVESVLRLNAETLLRGILERAQASCPEICSDVEKLAGIQFVRGQLAEQADVRREEVDSDAKGY